MIVLTILDVNTSKIVYYVLEINYVHTIPVMIKIGVPQIFVISPEVVCSLMIPVMMETTVR